MPSKPIVWTVLITALITGAVELVAFNLTNAEKKIDEKLDRSHATKNTVVVCDG